MLAAKYQTQNGLDAIFNARLSDSDFNDNLSLLQLYLSISFPTYLSEAENILASKRYGGGNETELFGKLAEKFRSTYPLNIVKKTVDRVMTRTP